MKRFFFVLTAFVTTWTANAQGLDKKYTNADFAISAGNGGFSTALSYTKMYGFGKSNRFKIGIGGRITSCFGTNIAARTAPASLTSGSESFGALAANDIAANIDTLNIKTAQTNALNATITLQYAVSKKLEFGFGIDAIGYTFGGKQTGTLSAKAASKRKFTDNTLVSDVTPTAFNALLVSDSDLGSLNSELYGRYWLSDKIGIRAGLSFQFVEYTSDKKVKVNNEENNRWRAKMLQPMIAISFRL
jgi:hypothetical protein